MRLAQLTREWREAKRLSLSEAGAQLGVSRQAVWTWEHGQSYPPAPDIPRIAKTLGVTICQLYGVEEGHSRPSENLTPAEQDVVNTIARELVKLRGQQGAGREPGRSTKLTLRNIVRDWRDLPADIQDQLLQAADAIRHEREQ